MIIPLRITKYMQFDLVLYHRLYKLEAYWLSSIGTLLKDYP